MEPITHVPSDDERRMLDAATNTLACGFTLSAAVMEVVGGSRDGEEEDRVEMFSLVVATSEEDRVLVNLPLTTKRLVDEIVVALLEAKERIKD